MGLFAQLPTLPYIPGRDGAGTIEKIGSEVDNLKVGNHVIILSNSALPKGIDHCKNQEPQKKIKPTTA